MDEDLEQVLKYLEDIYPGIGDFFADYIDVIYRCNETFEQMDKTQEGGLGAISEIIIGSDYQDKMKDLLQQLAQSYSLQAAVTNIMTSFEMRNALHNNLVEGFIRAMDVSLQMAFVYGYRTGLSVADLPEFIE